MKKVSLNKQISKLFRKKPKSSKSERVSFEHIWVLILSVSVALLIILLAWNIYLFVKIQRNEAFDKTSDIPERVATINREELARVLKTFEEYEQRFTVILERGVGLVDPSL